MITDYNLFFQTVLSGIKYKNEAGNVNLKVFYPIICLLLKIRDEGLDYGTDSLTQLTK